MAQNQPEIAVGGEKYPRYRWVMIGLLMLTQQLGNLVVSGIGLLLPAMMEDLGFGTTQGGLLGSIGRLPTAILSVPASLLLVRFSPKRVYFGALVFAAVTGFFSGQASGFVFLAVAYGLMGAATMITQIPDTLLRLQWIPRREFATVMGITLGVTATGSSVTMMLIPFLLIILEGWRNLFSVYGLTVLLLSIIWMVFARERITPEYQEKMSSQAGRSPLRSVLKRKEFPMLGIATFGNFLAYMTTMLFLPTYLLEERGMALSTIGLIVGLIPVGGVLANLIMGLISDRVGLRKPTIWPAGLILPFLYFGLFSLVPLWALPVFTFAIGFMAWAPFPAIRCIPFELPGVKPSEVAVGQSLISTITMMGMIFGAPAVGYLAEVLGSLRPALLIVSLFPLTLAIIGFLLPETGIKARPREGG